MLASSILRRTALGQTRTALMPAALSIQFQPPHLQRLQHQPQRRTFSEFSLLNLDDDEVWPRSQANTVLNVCPRGEVMVIERMGKLHRIQTEGYFFAIPVVDSIRFCVDMRERALNVEPQSAITKDNVHVHVSGNLYFQFTDPEKAAYGAKNPMYAVKQHAQSSMRAAIGELELDQILHDRVTLNTAIRSTVQEAAVNWGIDIKRYEITEVMPDQHIIDAMDKQAAAERERRKKVLEAEGSKRQLELESEGRKIQLQNESEGELIRTRNLAQARKERYALEAEGEAYAIKQRALAHAEAIEGVARVLGGEGAGAAAQLNMAREYVAMYGDIGQKSNTMFFSDKPADVNALMAQAATIFKAMPSSSSLPPQATGNAGDSYSDRDSFNDSYSYSDRDSGSEGVCSSSSSSDGGGGEVDRSSVVRSAGGSDSGSDDIVSDRESDKP